MIYKALTSIKNQGATSFNLTSFMALLIVTE